jgi:hypothetical protein
MALSIKLQFEPKEELRVMYCDISFTQMTDATGRPIAIPQGGLLNVVVYTDGKSNNLFDWMVDPKMLKSGKLIFLESDGKREFKTISFNDAYCVSYFEAFDLSGENHSQIRLTISSREVIMNNSKNGFVQNWPRNSKVKSKI